MTTTHDSSLTTPPGPHTALFYHVYCFGKWRTLVMEQLAKVLTSGLYTHVRSFQVGCSGSVEDIGELQKMLSPWPKIHVAGFAANHYEFSTFDLLQQFTHDNPGYRVGYFHTKGVTSNDWGWRKILDYWGIMRWRENHIALNQGYDAAGPLWLASTDRHRFRFFAGNYWWANGSYVLRLPRLRFRQGRSDRFECEALIGLRGPKVYNVSDPGNCFQSLDEMRTFVRSAELKTWARALDDTQEFQAALATVRKGWQDVGYEIPCVLNEKSSDGEQEEEAQTDNGKAGFIGGPIPAVRTKAPAIQ